MKGRSIKEGVGLGIAAGVIFAVVEVAASVMMGNPALTPFRMFSSVVLGRAGLEGVGPGTALVVGSLAHLALSAIYGSIYALIMSRASSRTRVSRGSQAGLGALFGLALWLVNFQVIARIAYPWFLGAPQFAQAILHALAFGLPLGLMYAGAERRVHPVRAAAVQP